MKIFDSHCHLDDRSFAKDINNVFDRARQSGVERMMIAGISLERSELAVRIAERNKNVYAAVGIHPHNAKSCQKATLEKLKKLARHGKVRAWGEIGLDFNRMFSEKHDQEQCFIMQLKVADELGLPVIFHERDSNGRLLELLKSLPNKQRKGVVHCFTGSKDELLEYLELGLCIGITGIITIQGRGKRLRELVPLIPADRILIETDAPYLVPAPEQKKHRRNEPAFLKSTLQLLSEVKGMKLEKLAETTWINTCRLFQIDTK
jgi:TatD DNase family protein